MLQIYFENCFLDVTNSSPKKLNELFEIHIRSGSLKLEAHFLLLPPRIKLKYTENDITV